MTSEAGLEESFRIERTKRAMEHSKKLVKSDPKTVPIDASAESRVRIIQPLA